MRHREVLDHECARGPPLGPKFVDGALVAGGEALGAGEVRYRRRELHSEDGHFCVLGSKNIGVLIRLRNHGLVVRLFLLLDHAPASFLGELDLPHGTLSRRQRRKGIIGLQTRARQTQSPQRKEEGIWVRWGVKRGRRFLGSGV